MAITIDSHHHLWQYSADDYPGSVCPCLKSMSLFGQKRLWELPPGLRRKAPREGNPVRVASTPKSRPSLYACHRWPVNGYLPQVHRSEREIYANIRLLLAAAGREVPRLGNVPNRYLQRKRRT